MAWKASLCRPLGGMTMQGIDSAITSLARGQRGDQNPRRFLTSIVAAVLLTLSGTAGWPETSRTIKIVVPLPPGGAGDSLTRLLGEQIRLTHAATVIVENRPGAGSIIGTTDVARAAPDGKTLL